MPSPSEVENERATQTDAQFHAIRDRLNKALLEVEHGEYFRARVFGWIAYHADAAIDLPEGVASRLVGGFSFDRPDSAADVSTLDAFMLAYHAAESLCRRVLALLDGDGPEGVPLIELAELKAGRAFNERLAQLAGMGDPDLQGVLDDLFLPREVQLKWSEGPPSIASVQHYLLTWFRALARFVAEWRNPYNSAKHGLALGSRPAHFSFFTEASGPSEAVTLMDGHTLRSVEHELVRGEDGKVIKHPDGKPVVRWSWMYRAVDAEELIAQTIVTADLLDWLHGVAKGRLLGISGSFAVRSEPLPAAIRRGTSPGRSIRVGLAALPLPVAEAEALLADDEDQ
jgi:hypothetical protein